jgi:uncharacterized protein (DUF1330 family)
MKSRISIALAVIAGFGLGAVSIHTLHAQAKPPAFTVVEIDVSNVDGYNKEYVPKAQQLLRDKGAKILVGTNNVITLEGAPAKRLAVHQWESVEKAKAWQASKEYKENRKIGDKYAKFRIMVVEGVPQK